MKYSYLKVILVKCNLETKKLAVNTCDKSQSFLLCTFFCCDMNAIFALFNFCFCDNAFLSTSLRQTWINSVPYFSNLTKSPFNLILQIWKLYWVSDIVAPLRSQISLVPTNWLMIFFFSYNVCIPTSDFSIGLYLIFCKTWKR